MRMHFLETEVPRDLVHTTSVGCSTCTGTLLQVPHEVLGMKVNRTAYAQGNRCARMSAARQAMLHPQPPVCSFPAPPPPAANSTHLNNCSHQTD